MHTSRANWCLAAIAALLVGAGVTTLARGLSLAFSYAIATGQPVGSPRFGSDLSVFFGTDLGIWLLSGLVIAAATTTVAVLGTAGHVAAVRAELGIALDADPASLLDEPIAVLTVDDARGLEFDSVVVVEPSAIAGETTAGLRALYVAITRSTRALVLVHSDPLPAALSGPS